jgi:hypothetical protein
VASDVNAPIKKRPPNTLGQREALTRVVDWTMTRAVRQPEPHPTYCTGAVAADGGSRPALISISAS